MQYNQKLDQFLNDTWLRSKTHKLISQSRKKILKDPLILKLNEYFKITYEQEISHMLPTLKKIIKKHTKQAITMIINELLNQSSKDAFFTFPITGHSNEFSQSSVISSNEYYDLGINIINKDELNQYKSESYKNIENRGIGFYGRHQLSYFIDAGGLEASAWEFPMGQNKQADELDLTSLKCNNPNNFRFKDSEFIYLQPNQTIMFEKAKKNVIMLTLEFKKNIFPLSLMFSAQHHDLKYQNPTLPEYSRMQFYCNLLKQMDYQKAIPAMKGLLNHDLHFIRWTAMQELLGLNALKVLKELKDMSTQDRHPQIRNAAVETLIMIENMEASHAG